MNILILFDILWRLAENRYKQTTSGHQNFKLWNQNFLNDLPHFPQTFLQLMFTSIYIFHLHITLINVSSQALLTFSLTLRSKK